MIFDKTDSTCSVAIGRKYYQCGWIDNNKYTYLCFYGFKIGL